VTSRATPTFLRSLGSGECFQSVGYQAFPLGVDDSVFFGLSVNKLEGVCLYRKRIE
jgi:hypothetical protein